MRVPFILSIIFFLTANASTQTTKQSFKKIQYATYRMDSGTPEIELYSEIDDKGVLKTYRKYQDEKSTTNTLNNDQIKILNVIFDGTQKLQASVARTKFERGVHYAGEYYFVIYTDMKGVSDTLSFIQPFMSESFQSNFKKAQEIFFRSKGQAAKTQLKIDSRFLQTLSESHKKTSYLPKFEAPPPGI